MIIRFHRRFEKEFDKLSQGIQRKFFERADLFRTDIFHPLLNNHSVDKRFPGCRSINVTGDYRAIFKERNFDVLFMRIGTHSELYG